ncbi:FHA domain-containing protein [Streptomyces sp. TLI_105]|uniref:FHA domain-containing protein n=1 Tax=Streptomyces sp. TLI_105 TaxID=1881019 RepID=UPI000895C118|nr:FHA domain-containing protein [Streptomyces sp. TLI_105]SED35872.1 Forkhead associated (FHA) domain, binds pSer, pThr, pTyr [Streptomyces sp. TLI_105]
MPTCPNGHQSVSDDWCEVCGHRMAGAGAPTGAVPPPPPPPPPAYGYPGPAGPGQPGPGQPPMGPPPGAPGAPGGFGPGAPAAPGGFGHGGDPNATAQAELCPQCRTPREPMAPFCEECRWNFLTNTATSYTPLSPHNAPHNAPPQQPGPPPGLNLPPGFQSSPPPPPQQPQQPQQQPDPFGYQGSRPSQVNRPAEPLGAEPTHHQAPPQRPPAQQQPPAPPAYLQAPAQAPAPPAPPQPRADDDWVLSPPSQHQPPQAPPQHQAPQAPQHQAPPHQAPPPPQQHQPPQPPPQQGPPPHQGPPPQHQHQGHQQGQQQPPQQFQPPRQQPLNWTAVIGPDREYFMAMMQRSGPEATGLNLPAYSPDKHLPLRGNQVSIGRRRHSTGESPDIDLSVPPEDPGVSHQHAVLVQQPDGSWAVVDQNSTNGTTVNGGEEPIQPYVPVQLQDGDRVHVGAWTTITIRLA